jgi:Flp pilus assembly protein TadB
VFSWACAFAVLLVAFGSARFAFHRFPLIGLLGLAGFKYASMFYVAGRLIEQAWRSVRRVAARSLGGSSIDEGGDLQVRRRETQGKMFRPRKKTLRGQMRQVRQSHVVLGRDREATRG